MQLGYLVVHRSGTDSEIYRISKFNDDDDTCEIISYVNGRVKTLSISQLREADDIEVMIGSRMKK